MSRINDAVRRILREKFELGLFEHPFTDRTHIDEIGSRRAPGGRPPRRRGVAGAAQEPRRPAAAAVRERDVYVAGSNADNIGNQAGGWTLTWQGGSTNVIPGTTILQGIEAASQRREVTYSEDGSAPIPRNDVGVVVVGETPYSEGFGDVDGRAGRSTPATTACRDRSRTCSCRPPTRPRSTASAAPSTASWSSSPAGR